MSNFSTFHSTIAVTVGETDNELSISSGIDCQVVRTPLHDSRGRLLAEGDRQTALHDIRGRAGGP